MRDLIEYGPGARDNSHVSPVHDRGEVSIELRDTQSLRSILVGCRESSKNERAKMSKKFQ